MNWRGKTVLVTGATGFIGGRMCERLVQAGAPKVRAMVHTIKRAARVARLPVELCQGNLRDRESLRRSLGDAKVVIHCGLGDWNDIVSDTRNVLEVAASAGVERFIHMSTAAVYGMRHRPGCDTEEAPLRTTGHFYCDNKMRTEKLAMRYYRRGLPLVILRPSIVYGPFSSWSTELVDKLKKGEGTLIDGGQGVCNTTYVDNLVDATFLALENEKALGEAFFITDDEAMTWGDFIRAHVAMIEPRPALREISTQEAEAYWRQQRGYWASSWTELRQLMVGGDLRKLLKRVPMFDTVITSFWKTYRDMDSEAKERLKTRLAGTNGAATAAPNGLCIPDPVSLAIQSHNVFIRTDKAREILGYEPRISFARGIHLVEQWLRFADYL